MTARLRCASPVLAAVGAAALTAAIFLAATPAVPAPPPAPFGRAGQMVMQAPLRELAPLVGTSAEQLAARLRPTGISTADPALSLDDIARANGVDPVVLMAAALR